MNLSLADAIKLAGNLPPGDRERVMRQLRSRPAATGEQARAVPSNLPRHVPGQMNRTEASYASHLEALRQAGVVKWYKFEAIKVRLATRAWLTIDFPVVYADGRVELVDVKGRRGDRYYATEDAKLKIRFAAETLPWPVAIVWPLSGGGWGREDFGKVER